METPRSKNRISRIVTVALFTSTLVLATASSGQDAMARPATPNISIVASVPNQVQGKQGKQGDQGQPNPSQPDVAVGSGFTYQGQLKDGGNPANGQYDFTFKLYDASSGGTQVGTTVTMLNQTVSGGLFTVLLDFGSSAFQGQARWMEIAVRVAGGPSYTTLAPRQALTVAPYAASLMPGAVITGTTGTVLSAINTGGNSGIYGVSTGSNGNGVVGEANNGSSAYGVWGSSTGGVGVVGNSSSGHGVFGSSSTYFGVAGSTGGGSAVAGVSGLSSGANGVGVKGQANNGTVALGVWGVSSNGRGVYGSSDFGSGVYGAANAGFGVYGDSVSYPGVYGRTSGGSGVGGVSGLSTGANGVGVYGAASNGVSAYGVHGSTSGGSGVRAEATTSGNGVYATSSSGNGVYATSSSANGVYGSSAGGSGVGGVYGTSTGANGVGVLGTASNGTTALGVWGSSSGGRGVYGSADTGVGVYGAANSGWAGYFLGNVNVTGTCCAAGEAYTRIDHPLDPQNKYLNQALVQSPDMLTTINGNVTTDAKGEAVVTLPDWFEALNRDFRYQLTIMGDQFAQARIASKIKDNHFTIKTDKPNIEVSWQVSGIRKDPYAETHPIQVEVEKSAEEQGKYLHPTEYGQPESKGIDYPKIPPMEQVQVNESLLAQQGSPQK